ncbi:MAG: transcriptional regulator [Cellvibrionaceae bacterium]|nr:transcriptional regulator [Cellvibrionaceae bacterium]|tara:strand:+ start:3699 stop:4241 length:543 start_codon:yes stop_codon:yes gene_type:complete
MRIGELAERSGVAAHTIRFYENKGLLPPAERSHNGYRSYDEQTLERLTLVQLCQRLGFNLAEIQRLISQEGDWDKAQILVNLDARLEEIYQLQQSLDKQRLEILTIKDQLQDRWQKGGCVTGPELQCLSRHLHESTNAQDNSANSRFSASAASMTDVPIIKKENIETNAAQHPSVSPKSR